jgi:HSP20 family protein
MSLLNHILPSLNRPADAACAAGATCSPAESVTTIRPVYDVQETAEAYRLTVQLPGVAKDALELTAENGEFRIAGRRAWTPPTGWTALHRETPDVAYELVLTHDDAIDADRIGAELKDGILQVTLPKHEAVKPRKIAVA